MTQLRSRLLVSMGATCALLSTPRSPVACPVLADREEVVVADVGAAGRVELSIFWFRQEDGGTTCRVYASIAESRLPSVRVAPSPLAVLDQIGPLAAEEGTVRCRVSVSVEAESEPAPDSDDDWLRSCRAGEFAYSGGRWWPVDPDAGC